MQINASSLSFVLSPKFHGDKHVFLDLFKSLRAKFTLPCTPTEQRAIFVRLVGVIHIFEFNQHLK